MRMSVLKLIFLVSLAVGLGGAQNARPLPGPDVALSNQFKLALDAIFGMGIRLQALLQDEQNENFVVSPISAAVVIGQLILGAEGEFRRDLVDLLSLPNSDQYENNKIMHYGKKNYTLDLPYSLLHMQLCNLLKNLQNKKFQKEFILKQHSGVFVSNKIKLKNAFKNSLQKFYNAQIYDLDFEKESLVAQQFMNSWVLTNTNGLIQTILPTPPPPTTLAIFANTIYFKADWEIPFSDVLNRNGSFTVNEEKCVDVIYMIGILEEILYSESDDYRLIALPYKNEELGMYIMLPNHNNKYKYDMKNFLKNINVDVVTGVIHNARRRDVIVKIPKLKFSKSFSILDELQKYQIYKNYDLDKQVNTTGDVADVLKDRVQTFNNFNLTVQKDIFLTNAAKQHLRVDNIIQQVYLTVNEKGTEAAAVSASTIDYIGGQKNFLLDRPFSFFIRHEATSATLFWGSISNPSSTS